MSRLTAGAAARAAAGGGSRAAEQSTPGHSLGLSASSNADLIHAIERGLPFRSLSQLAETLGIDTGALAEAAGIPARALARRKAAHRFEPSESERLVRIGLVAESALRLFNGDTSEAAHWLISPRDAFEGQSPLDYCRTDLGAREVEDLIGRLEYGVFS